jgi:hypothetical protein
MSDYRASVLLVFMMDAAGKKAIARNDQQLINTFFF